jgi:hypothetical protein
MSTGSHIFSSLTASVCVDIWTEINLLIPALCIAASLANMACRRKAFSTNCFYVIVRFKVLTTRDICLSVRYNYLHSMAQGTAEWCAVLPGHFAFWQTALFAHCVEWTTRQGRFKLRTERRKCTLILRCLVPDI